jgi:hypothetical protein
VEATKSIRRTGVVTTLLFTKPDFSGHDKNPGTQIP